MRRRRLDNLFNRWLRGSSGELMDAYGYPLVNGGLMVVNGGLMVFDGDLSSGKLT